MSGLTVEELFAEGGSESRETALMRSLGLEFEVTIFMEREKKFPTFTEAFTYMHGRIAEEMAKGNINTGNINTHWIDVLFEGTTIGPLMVGQIGDMARSLELLDSKSELVKPTPNVDDDFLLLMLANKLGESWAYLLQRSKKFRGICEEIKSNRVIKSATDQTKDS